MNTELKSYQRREERVQMKSYEREEFNQTEERVFEIRHHQLPTQEARELQVTDLLKEDRELSNPADGIALSKADIILIYALYKGGIIEFFELYMEYVRVADKKRWKGCDKPHWFLKRSID